MDRWIPAAFLVLLGCSGGYRFGAGPLLDSDGRVGLQVSVGGFLGFAPSDDVALEETVDLAIGGQGGPSGFILSPIVGIDFVKETDEDGLAWRAGLRTRFHFVFEGDQTRSEIGAGVALGLLLVIDEGSRYRRHLGGELTAYLASPMTGEREAYGLFGLNFVYEARSIEELQLGSW